MCSTGHILDPAARPARARATLFIRRPDSNAAQQLVD
jgi:hypothetical protein